MAELIDGCGQYHHALHMFLVDLKKGMAKSFIFEMFLR